MTVNERIITITIISLTTMLTRFLPFIIFPSEKPTPPVILYLGKVLPSAVFGLLIIYCFKNGSIFTGNHLIPEFIASAFTVFLHLKKRQMLVSIAGGAVLYMLLVQFIF